MELVEKYLLIKELSINNDVCNEIWVYFIKRYLNSIELYVKTYYTMGIISHCLTGFSNLEDILQITMPYTEIFISNYTNNDNENINYILTIIKSKLKISYNVEIFDTNDNNIILRITPK